MSEYLTREFEGLSIYDAFGFNSAVLAELAGISKGEYGSSRRAMLVWANEGKWKYTRGLDVSLAKAIRGYGNFRDTATAIIGSMSEITTQYLNYAMYLTELGNIGDLDQLGGGLEGGGVVGDVEVATLRHQGWMKSAAEDPSLFRVIAGISVLDLPSGFNVDLVFRAMWNAAWGDMWARDQGRV